jgi:hypothetical protein
MAPLSPGSVRIAVALREKGTDRWTSLSLGLILARTLAALPVWTLRAGSRHLREFDRLGEDLAIIESDLARSALAGENVARLKAIPGVDMVVALAIIAAIGDINRFGEPQKLVSYLGLNPSVRQSGPGPAHHGRITKQGRGHARGMLVEAAWAAARPAPGPLRAFFLRVRAKRGQHVAAVATARKLALLIWHLSHKKENYAWARPALQARKIRKLELKAGYEARRGQKGSAHAYNVKGHREQERRLRPLRGGLDASRGQADAKGAHGRRQFMRDNWLSNRVFTSYEYLLNHCCEAWNKLIDQPWRIMSIGMRD